MLTQIEKLNELNRQINEDFAKSEKGNKAAGVRARKALMDTARLTKELRNEVLLHRSNSNNEKDGGVEW